MYNWGVGRDGASRKPEYDKINLKVPVDTLAEEVESFTITVSDVDTIKLNLMWDKTLVAVPIIKNN